MVESLSDGWEKTRNPYTKLDFGKWELHLPANPDGSCPIKHGSKVKVSFVMSFVDTKDLS